MSKPLLSSIRSPLDLHRLPLDELPHLADEIRSRIIEVMSVNGGHLASNLGAVELTIALHRTFQSPLDKFIWDVSHQTYTHKLLTGRQEQFHTIRQFEGLCGFSHPKESDYDHFHAGHAGTALSLALGVAKTRDLTQRQNYVIPIIGDATLTCGMSLEALNNVSRNLKRFIVILNDNAMSIAKNVGAVTNILSRMLSNPTTHRIYQELNTLVSKIPSYGSALAKHGHKVTESLKNLVSPAAFFEEFGLSYIGPIDGHDIKKLSEVLEELKDSNWPVIVHVMTNKGHGMPEAIRDPVCYHGAKPFSLDTGKFLPAKSNKPTFPAIFGKQILKMAEADPTLVVVTPAMTTGSCLTAMHEKFPERCIDVGIAEAHAITYSGGIAYGKELKVVASIYATFLQRALDNLFHDVCLQELPVVFAIDRAGISGPDGATHHGIYDIGFLNAMPNMIISQPRDGQVLKELLESAFQWGQPTAIRYPNLATEESDQPLKPRQPGEGELLTSGKDLLIIALGHMNTVAKQVREKLLEQGIEAAIFDPVFLKPLDTEQLCHLLLSHQKLVTIEEHAVSAGMGAIINHFLISQGYQQVQVLNLGIPETFVEHGSNAELLDRIGLSPSKICQQILHTFHFEKEPAALLVTHQ